MVERDGGTEIRWMALCRVVHEKLLSLRVRNGKVIDGQKGICRGKGRVGDKGSWSFEIDVQVFELSRYRNGIG